MPFYGDIDFFKAAINSVLEQSDPSWKLVVLDDKYPDTSAGTWLVNLGDSRITYIRNDVNLGVSGNFAKCVEVSDAEYTTIMGCDDVLLPNYVAEIKGLIEEFPDASYIQPGVKVIDSADESVLSLVDRVKSFYMPKADRATVRAGEPLAKSLIRGNWSYFPSIAWRTELMREFGFRQGLSVVLDLALQLEIVSSGGTMVHGVEAAYGYRRHSGSVSSWTAEDGSRFREESAFFAESAGVMRNLGWHGASRAAKLHLSSRLNELTQVPRAFRAGGFRSALAHIGHALHWR